MKNRLINCLEENGIEVNNDGTLGEFESISFISALVSIEEEFQMEFPDEYLSFEEPLNLDVLIDIIVHAKSTD